MLLLTRYDYFETYSELQLHLNYYLYYHNSYNIKLNASIDTYRISLHNSYNIKIKCFFWHLQNTVTQ